MRLSVVLPNCDYFLPAKGDSLHGAFLSTAKFLHWVANEPAFDKLEVFLPPGAITEEHVIQASAQNLLEPANRGKGRLSFYPFHSIPEVWADRAPRILRSLDPHFMARDRFLRDSFATGPTALSVDTHTIGTHDMQQSLRNVLDAHPVAYDSIQCISHSMKEYLERNLQGFGFEKVPFRLDIIQRPIETSLFRPPSEQERIDARRKLGIPENANVAIYHSRVGPHTKADIYPFIQAFADCSGSDDWLIIGGPPSSEDAYEKIENWLRAAKVEKRCRLIGPCQHSDVPGRLWAADFFVLPCDNPSEGLGIAPTEALACGLPALVSDWDGMREAVREGVNGFFVPTHWFPGSGRISAFSSMTPFSTEFLLLAQCIVLDQSILTEKLGRLFRDPELRMRLSQGAIESTASLSDVEINKRILVTMQEQLAEAGRDSGAEREARRLMANKLVYPTNYEELLPKLASRTVQASDIVELTEKGKLVLAGEAEMAIFEEVSMLARPQDIAAVLDLLRSGPRLIEDILESLGGKQFGDGYYVLAFLSKRDIIRLTKTYQND